jgi:HEAT repeat protein
MPAETRPDILQLLKRIPESDDPGRTSPFTGPDPALAEMIFDQILAGGRESIIALAGLVRDPRDEDFKDFRPQYVLHGLALRAGRPGNEEKRRLFAETLASLLDDGQTSKAVKGLLIQELQAAGGKESIAALGAKLLDDDLGEPAARALLAIGAESAGEFRIALPKAKGVGRVTIILGLGVLPDGSSTAALKEAAGDPDRAVRMAAVWALGSIADPDGAETLHKASVAEDGWERSQAAKACLIFAERLQAAGKREEAKRVYQRLRESRKENGEAHIREAAERGLSS